MRVISQAQLCAPYREAIANAKVPWPPENMMSNVERQCVLSVALEHNQDKAILEIGTYEGFTTAVLARLFPQKKVYTVDIPPHVTHHEQPGVHLGHHYKSNGCSNVIQILQDSMELDPEKIDECDFILVDGDHKLDSVFHDVGIAMFLLVPGGAMMLDDCFMEGPAEVIKTIQQTYPEYKWTQIEGTKLAYCVL